MNKDEMIENLENIEIHVNRANSQLKRLDVDEESADFDLKAVNEVLDTIIENIDMNYRYDNND